MSIDDVRRKISVPVVTFGPFRFLEVMPWLLLAAALRIVAYASAVLAIPATAMADIVILLAFVLATRRSIELAGGRTALGELEFREQLRLCWAILFRIALLMIGVAVVVRSPHAMMGLDGMAFDQSTYAGMVWSATIAALVLLMLIRAEYEQGKVDLFAAMRELVQRFVWLGSAIAILAVVYIILNFVQGYFRQAVAIYWQQSGDSYNLKTYVSLAYVVSFATLRLWITLLVLTAGLKRSYVDRPAG